MTENPVVGSRQTSGGTNAPTGQDIVRLEDSGDAGGTQTSREASR